VILAITGASGGTPLVPRIIAQPSATLTGYKNQSITIRVVAIGVSLQFQWYKGSDPISGATLTSLLLQNLQDSDQASYYCVVSNANGTLTSTSCALTVAEGLPTITAHPQSQTVFEGQGLSLSVSATPPAGSTLAYMWQASDNNGVSWSNLGITSSTYSLPRAEMQIDGGQFRCRVTASQSGAVVFSDAATISVTQVFTSQPQDIFGGIGDVVLSCELSQSRACKLQRSLDGGQTFADVNVHYDGLTNVVTGQYNPTQQTGATIELRGNPATPYISSTKYRIKVTVGSGQFTYSRDVDVNILLRPNSVSIKTPCRKGAVAELNQAIEDTTGLMFVWSYGDAGAEVASGRSQFSDQLTGTLPNDAYGTVRCSLNTAQTGTDRVSTAEVPALAALEITTQPQGVSAKEAGPVQLSIAVGSADLASNLTYSWRSTATSGSEFASTREVSGIAYHPGYQSPAEASSDPEGDLWASNGAQVWCVVSDTLGNSVTSSNPTISVGSAKPVVAPGYSTQLYAQSTGTWTLSDFGLSATSNNAPIGRRDTGVLQTYNTSGSGSTSEYYMLSDYPNGKPTYGNDTQSVSVVFFNEFGETGPIDLTINWGQAPSTADTFLGASSPMYPAVGSASQLTNGASQNFEIGSGNYPQSFAWEVLQSGSPANPSDFTSSFPSSSSDSTSGNYQITFWTPGVYDVKVTATNSWGSAQSTKTLVVS
jgi:hypothetical protein